MSDESRPEPPEDALAYVSDPLGRQPADRFREIAAWVKALAAHKDTTGGRDPDRQAQIRECVADATGRDTHEAGTESRTATRDATPARADTDSRERLRGREAESAERRPTGRLWKSEEKTRIGEDVAVSPTPLPRHRRR